MLSALIYLLELTMQTSYQNTIKAGLLSNNNFIQKHLLTFEHV